MYFFDWVHSLLFRDCYHAMRYWVIRAFWNGYYDREYYAPLRCPDVDLWRTSWVLGHDWRTEQDEVGF